jgi:hypothetical protein
MKRGEPIGKVGCRPTKLRYGKRSEEYYDESWKTGFEYMN